MGGHHGIAKEADKPRLKKIRRDPSGGGEGKIEADYSERMNELRGAEVLNATES